MNMTSASAGNYDYAPGPYNGFRGAMDDVRIYNRALPATEVQQLYAYESVPEPSTLALATSAVVIAAVLRRRN